MLAICAAVGGEAGSDVEGFELLTQAKGVGISLRQAFDSDLLVQNDMQYRRL
jgi:hypothetical protein